MALIPKKRPTHWDDRRLVTDWFPAPPDSPFARERWVRTEDGWDQELREQWESDA
jgi:hypothetical protein